MFKTLRNKLILINMAVITIVMLIAFSVIYLTTFQNTFAQNKEKLDRSQVITGAAINIDEGNNNFSTTPSNGAPLIVSTLTLTDDLLFNVEVGADGAIYAVRSFFDMPAQAYEQAAATAWQQQRNYEILPFEGRRWMYTIQPAAPLGARIENGHVITQVTDTFIITFLDVTASLQTQFMLFTTLVFVGIGMLFIILGVSLYFANRAIAPMQVAWDKQRLFMADASHELKTPLAIISANAEALRLCEKEDSQGQQKWLGYIQAEIARMSKLIGDMLYLARMEDVSSADAMAVVDLSRIAQEALFSMEALAYEKGLRLLQDILEGVNVQGNEEQLRRLLLILMDNAVKYTPSGGWIHISLKKDKQQTVFSIQNCGDGIAESDLEKLFDRFYRPDAARNSESGGYGLGLPIARAIAQKMGAKISAQSTLGESTTFSVIWKG